MAKFTGTKQFQKVGLRTGLRVLVRKLFESAANHPAVEQVIAIIAQFLRSIPGGEDFGTEVINDLNPTVRTIVEPIWRRVVLGSETAEDDVSNGRKGRKKDSRSPDSGSPKTTKALDIIYSISETNLRDTLLALIAKVPAGKITQVLERLGSQSKLAITGLARRMADKGEEADLLTEPLFADLADIRVSASGAPEPSSSVSDMAREVLSWLFGKDQSAFKAILEIIGSDANDSANDRPAFEKWLASFHHLGEEKAIDQLVEIAGMGDEDSRARLAGVKPNYLTRFFRLLGSMVGSGESSFDEGSPHRIRLQYSRARELLGLPQRHNDADETADDAEGNSEVNTVGTTA